MVKRFVPGYLIKQMVEYDKGPFVRYCDYEALEKETEEPRLRAARKMDDWLEANRLIETSKQENKMLNEALVAAQQSRKRWEEAHGRLMNEVSVLQDKLAELEKKSGSPSSEEEEFPTVQFRSFVVNELSVKWCHEVFFHEVGDVDEKYDIRGMINDLAIQVAKNITAINKIKAKLGE